MTQVGKSVKETSSKYREVHEKLNPDVMVQVKQVLDDIKAKNPKRPSKPSQPLSTSDGDLDPHNVGYLIQMLKDAVVCKPALDTLVSGMVSDVAGAQLITAPIKGLPRILHKVSENYDCNFSSITDLVRLTVECEDETALLKVLRRIAESAAAKPPLIFVDRVKDRLQRDEHVVSGGGYEDLQFLVRMAENGHVCEVQFNLAPFVGIKQGGGHKAYAAARMVAAFEPV
eukprot:1272072-Prymnesium_polylepis.1